MAYDEELDARLSDALAPFETVRKKMFGGTCHIMHGNMLAGVWQDCLILRLGEPVASEALAQPHVVPFDITGKPLRGWVMVEPPGADGQELERWLALALDFVGSLPPK